MTDIPALCHILLSPAPIGSGCVHTDTSPGFRLWPVKASLIRVECSRSLVQAHNSTCVDHIEQNQIEEMLRDVKSCCGSCVSHSGPTVGPTSSAAAAASGCPVADVLVPGECIDMSGVLKS